MSQITFLHAADLHLDSPYIGLKHLPELLFKRVQESTFISLQRIIDVAIKKQVDFIIVAGDLYDAEQRSLKAQVRFRNEMLRLEREGIQAYIIHGNHDPLNGDWVDLDWPENVHIFKEEVEVKPFVKQGKHLANLYGFSYLHKAVTENMAVQYEKRSEECYHIGILHGTISNNKDHTPYAPFQLSDLKSKDFDYWALGHIHQKQILHDAPPIVYSGNIQGRNKKETGEKGCYYVSIGDAGCNYSFIDSADILWEPICVSISDLNSVDDLLSLCKLDIEQLRRTNQGVFVHLQISGYSELSTILQEDIMVDDMIEILQAGEDERHNFVWISSYENHTQTMDYRENLKKELHFVGDLLHQFEQYEHVDQALAPLYKHKEGRRFISPLQLDEKEALVNEAEKWIINELLHVKDRG
jgi:exonuclease SbcD